MKKARLIGRLEVVYDTTGTAGSIEEQMLELQERKRTIAAGILDGDEATDKHKLVLTDSVREHFLVHVEVQAVLQTSAMTRSQRTVPIMLDAKEGKDQENVGVIAFASLLAPVLPSFQEI